MQKHFLLLLIFFSYFWGNAQVTDFVTSNNSLKHSQNLVISETYYKNEKEVLVGNAKKAKRLKIAGLFFTSLGAAGVVTTVPFMAVYGVAFKEIGWGVAASTAVGIIGITPSAACLIAGIPMTIVGYKKAKEAKKETLKEF